MVLRVTTGSSDFTSATSTLDTSSSDQSAAGGTSAASVRRRALPAVASRALRKVLEPMATGPAAGGILLGTAAQSPLRSLMATNPEASTRTPAQQLWEERFAGLHSALDRLGALLGLEEKPEEEGDGEDPLGSPRRSMFALEARAASQSPGMAPWHLPAGARLAGARAAAAAPRRALSADAGAQAASGGDGRISAHALLASRRQLQVVANGGCGGPALAAPPNSSFSALGLADVRTISSSCSTPQAGDMDVALTVLAGMMADLERMSASMLEEEVGHATHMTAVFVTCDACACVACAPVYAARTPLSSHPTLARRRPPWTPH